MMLAHGSQMCTIDFVDDVMHINEWAGLNVIFALKACKHDISETVGQIYFKLCMMSAHGPQMCTIDFVDDVMHNNEWVGLNVILAIKACKHYISETVWQIYFKLGMMLAHGPQMCTIDVVNDVVHIIEWVGLNMILSIKDWEHNIFEMITEIYIILFMMLLHDPQMCTIDFLDDHMHINEWVGLIVKLVKQAYLDN